LPERAPEVGSALAPCDDARGPFVCASPGGASGGARRPPGHGGRPGPDDTRPPGPIRTEPNRGDEMTRPTPQLLAQRAARRGTVAPVPAETAGDAATAPRLPTTGAGALVRSLEALGVEVV